MHVDGSPSDPHENPTRDPSIMHVVDSELALEERSAGGSLASPADFDPTLEMTSPSVSKQQHFKVPDPMIDVDLPPQAPSVAETANLDTANASLDRKALILLLVQHFSSSWGSRTAEFAIYLFLVTLFPDSLLPASIFGFLTTGTAIVLSGWAGHQVDIRNNLRLVRVCIMVVKASACGAYAGSLVLFYRLGMEEQLTQKWSTPLDAAMFALIVICGCIQNLSGVALSVAIERDWVTVIAEGSSEHLTLINTYMRRIDLLCKLLAPLFVSLLTSVTSNIITAYCLCGVEAVCIVFELLWVDIVYQRFPSLLIAQAARQAEQQRQAPLRRDEQTSGLIVNLVTTIQSYLRATLSDWHEFIQHPIFLSSISISCLYFTVLSFDGTMISYLKSESYTDPFIAGMRGLNVVAGLLGTVAMPFLERRLGLVRAGNWSIWSEVVCLLPVTLSFFVGGGQPNAHGPAWKSALLFGGMMLSRIGLWAFDLCQLKELQLALASHPRRNAMWATYCSLFCSDGLKNCHRSALQYSLQNIADMLKYVLTMILSRPSQFRTAALTSFVSVVIGATTYLGYVRRERGHILHSFSEKIPLLRRRSE
ncbi:uncharacterized protein B0H18DRAFT_416644 [Fomitopsis serialis]|uniref:uncharacterized protein n=1 Tax=Fomitopsis serialis TaxID=139415 RepID=UPI00200734C6|nr:uncharacterized protein B0H18DRAFT_416644 [Neoantrodia serialis]KAH9935560.1 hypothetical protein B0H18DRAFT_416644 [Neoantrodia serialis]